METVLLGKRNGIVYGAIKHGELEHEWTTGIRDQKGCKLEAGDLDAWDVLYKRLRGADIDQLSEMVVLTGRCGNAHADPWSVVGRYQSPAFEYGHPTSARGATVLCFPKNQGESSQ